MNGNQKLFGYHNCAFYSNGTTRYYTSRKEAQTAMEELRAHAISEGLAKSAAESGIYEVKSITVAEARRKGITTVIDLGSETFLD